MIPPIWIFWK